MNKTSFLETLSSLNTQSRHETNTRLDYFGRANKRTDDGFEHKREFDADQEIPFPGT